MNMNARELTGMLRFAGGRDMLILRDHEAGRIKVYKKGEWIFTVIPGSLLGVRTECVLLGKAEQDGVEERTTWGGAAYALSMFQQYGDIPAMDSGGFPLFEENCF